YKPGPGQFLEIDPKIIVERMALRDRAGERARADQPPSDSASMDEVEQEIESTIRTIASEDQARTYDQIATYQQRLAGAAGGCARRMSPGQRSICGCWRARPRATWNPCCWRSKAISASPARR